MKIYKVGGSVRDALLGIESNDVDYVVVGSSEKEMLSLGYTQVGSSFPVFLHPVTGDQYALARKERKVAESYNGFLTDCVGVSLEDDLLRRDLTINALAYDETNDSIVDPYGGIQDLNNKTLRHVSEAFAEDPLRVLRVARFLARFGEEWNIHDTTKELMDNIYKTEQLKHLTKERVWLETYKALNTKHPWLYFDTLKGYNLFNVKGEDLVTALSNTPQREDHHPEGDVWTHTKMMMQYLVNTHYDSQLGVALPEMLFAALTHDIGRPSCWVLHRNAHGHEDIGAHLLEDLFKDLKVIPTNFKRLSMRVCKYHTKVHGCLGRGANGMMTPKSIMKLFEGTNALLDPNTFKLMLEVCEADAKGRGGDFPNKPYPQKVYLSECLDEVLKLDTKPISGECLAKGVAGIKIGERIRCARIHKIREVYEKWKKLM